jgi:hypothetical protein
MFLAECRISPRRLLSLFSPKHFAQQLSINISAIVPLLVLKSMAYMTNVMGYCYEKLTELPRPKAATSWRLTNGR